MSSPPADQQRHNVDTRIEERAIELIQTTSSMAFCQALSASNPRLSRGEGHDPLPGRSEQARTTVPDTDRRVVSV
ncbi:MAG: hypothetical protein NZ743_02325 [Pseudomonadales bacterium]|nr:hypothetical protein [Pseudomonadales bacterium]